MHLQSINRTKIATIVTGLNNVMNFRSGKNYSAQQLQNSFDIQDRVNGTLKMFEKNSSLMVLTFKVINVFNFQLRCSLLHRKTVLKLLLITKTFTHC